MGRKRMNETGEGLGVRKRREEERELVLKASCFRERKVRKDDDENRLALKILLSQILLFFLKKKLRQKTGGCALWPPYTKANGISLI